MSREEPDKAGEGATLPLEKEPRQKAVRPGKPYKGLTHCGGRVLGSPKIVEFIAYCIFSEVFGIGAPTGGLSVATASLASLSASSFPACPAWALM